MNQELHATVLPDNSCLTCVGCHAPADVFLAKRRDHLSTLTVDNTGSTLCASCLSDRPGWLFIEGTR